MKTKVSDADANVMYEINWHYSDDQFSHCTVTPIKVIRKDILPGCTKESITAVDSTGRQFQGSPDNYFSTEAKAWASVEEDLRESIRTSELLLAKLNGQIDTMYRFLARIPE